MEDDRNMCLKLIFDALKENMIRVVLLIILCFVGAFLPSITPLVYQQIVDKLIPAHNFRALYIYVAILISIPVATSLLLNWRNVEAYKISEGVTRNLRISLFEKITRMNYSEYLRLGSKALVYRITRSCGQIGDVFLNNTLLSLLNASFSLILVFVPMLVLEYRLALVVLVAFPIVYLLLTFVKKHIADKDKKLFEVLVKGEGLFHEALEGLRVMRLSGGKGKQSGKVQLWLQEHLEIKKASVNAHEFERVSLSELCNQALYGLIFILGAIGVMTERMSIGELVAFVAYIPRALNSIKELLLIQVAFKSKEPFFDSINEVLNMPEESSAPEDLLQLPSTFRNLCMQQGIQFT